MATPWLRQHSTLLDIPIADSTHMTLSADLTSEEISTRDGDEPSEHIETNLTRSLYLPPVELPTAVNESSFFDRTVIGDVASTPVAEFTVIEKGTKRGKPLLVESDGYTYTVKKISNAHTFWWCSVRHKEMRCAASVTQHGELFRRGFHNHSHPAVPGVLLHKQMTMKNKDEAANNIFRSAMSLVEEELHKARPNAVNLLDQTISQETPTISNRNFAPKIRVLAVDFLPTNFLREDLMVDGARHLIFATPQHLQFLSQAKRWYVDATFKVLRSKDTFEKLFGIHTFFRKGEDTKQVPLVFVFMTRRRKKTINKSYRKSKTCYQPPLPPAVTGFVLDFEAAVWKAIRRVFPEANVSGCAFHWTQAVWKKVQALGLSTNYRDDAGTHKVIRRLLAMPLLPETHIHAAFENQRRKIAGIVQVEELFNYVLQTWIDGPIWKPKDWSVYGQSVRTNNDCEGWHRRINYRATSAPPFYALIDMLHQEAKLVDIQAKLVSEKKLKKRQKKKARSMQSMIFGIWETCQQTNC